MTEATVFAVSSYEILVAVAPILKQEIAVRHGEALSVVTTDNTSRIERYIAFSPANARLDRFTLRHSTRGAGFIAEPVFGPAPNEASAADLGRYADHGKEVTYTFTPEAGSKYFLRFLVLKGFDPGSRNVHFHLHRNTQYDRVLVTLDLSGYTEYGYPISQLPTLYFHPEDPEDHGFCSLRGVGRVTQPLSRGRGRVTWELRDVCRGVIDVIWDVEGPERDYEPLDAETQQRQKLITEHLTACMVFDLCMSMIAEDGSISFREVSRMGGNRIHKYGFGSDLPLSQPQITRLIAELEIVLSDPAFFGHPIRLFDRAPGKASRPTDKAHAALQFVRPGMKRIVDSQPSGR